MAQLVLLERFLNLPDAAVAQSVLDHHGIHSFLFDRHLTATNWLYLFAVGGQRLYMLDRDAVAARTVLDDGDTALMDGGVAACPACGSGNLKRDISLLAGLAALVVLHILFVWRTRGRTCLQCGRKFLAASRHD